VDGTIRANSRSRAAIAAIALGYFGIALLQGGYATTAIAWGAIAVWAIVALAIILGIWPRGDLPRAAVVAIACWAGLAVLSALSATWANDAGRAFSATLLPGVYAGLTAFVVLSSRTIAARSWLLGLLGGTMLTTAIALASRLDPGFLGASDVGVLLPGSAGRLSYPIGYWNGLAACVAVGVVLLVWLGSQARDRDARAIAIGLVPIGGLALYLTSSRGGFAAVALGIAVLVALGPGRARLLAGAGLGAIATLGVSLFARGRYDLIHDLGTGAQQTQGLEVALVAAAAVVAAGGIRWWLDPTLSTLAVPRPARRIGLVVLIAGAVAGLVLANPFSKVQQFDSGSGSATPGQRSLFSASGSGRAQFWEAAVDAFASRPLGGVGAGNYELYWNAHPEAAIVTGNAHSLFLEELADLGPLGLLLVLGPFAAALVAAYTRWRRAPPEFAPALALLATAGVGATIDWTWRIPAAFIPALVAIGLLTGRATLPATNGVAGAVAGRARPRGVRGFGLGVATLLFAWGIVWMAAVVILASWRLASSRDAVARGDLAAAASDARSAASVEPFSAEPRLQLALIEELAGNPVQARAAAEEAIQRAPGDWRGWAVAARIDRESNAPKRGDRELFIAQTLSPVPLPRTFTRPP
jgi:O-antigen ligase/polysaccharide polymerase Wzy-like membrane protein